MKIFKNLLIITLICPGFKINCEPAIVTFLQTPPPSVLKKVERKVETKLNQFSQKSPVSSSKKLLKAQLLTTPSQLDGFLGIYKGYSDFSNKDGLITFPLRHTPINKMYITVTPEIKMTLISEHTFANLTIPKSVEAKMYLLEKLEGDYEENKLVEKKENKYLYWNVIEQEIPETGIIPSISVVYLTKPKNLFVQEGQFLLKEDSNLILPNNVYVTGRINTNKALFTFLDLSRFFDPISFKTKMPNKKTKQSLFEN
ncbi:hypothetical protein KAW80_00560 [Candidatus Babeliales bacterium]|nr:hypothetical protein [Candidatus Babeliales bacterium]